MMPNWKKIKAEYIRGNTSYRLLAEKYGVSFSTLRLRAAREKWTDLKNKTQAKIDTKLSENAANKEANKNDLFSEIADKLLQHISESIDNGKIFGTGKGYRDITGALKDLKEIKNIKSELDMEEQIARIEKLCKDCESGEEGKEIKVVISEEMKKFSK